MKFLMVVLVLAAASCGGGGGGGSPPAAPFVPAEAPALSHPWLGGYWVGPMTSDNGGPPRLLQVQLVLGTMLDQSAIYTNASGSGDAYGSGVSRVSGFNLRAGFAAMGYSRTELDLTIANDFNSMEGSYQVWLQAINGGPPFDTGRVRLVRQTAAIEDAGNTPIVVSKVVRAGDLTVIYSIHYPPEASAKWTIGATAPDSEPQLPPVPH